MQATKNITVDSDGWSSKRSAYLPPHARKAAEEAARKEAKKLDINSATQFPTLGSAATKLETPWESKTSFKEKIDGLIAFEQLSEREKQARLQAKRAMEGFVLLSLRITPEDRAILHMNRHLKDLTYSQWEQDVDCGIQGLVSLEKEIKKTPLVTSRTKQRNTRIYDDEEEEEEEEHVYAEDPESCEEYN